MALENFEYSAPTRVYFGKEEHKLIGKLIKERGFKNVLLHYGSGSIKKNGLYDEICACLRAENINFTELGGVEPNPKLSLVRVGAKLCKEKNTDLILAVGGGSVIDSAKAIAMAAVVDFDFWDFHDNPDVKPMSALPVAAVLTISAAGSETSTNCVITNDETGYKRGLKFVPPLFSILNPELTYTVSKYQTACGIVDIMMHTLERYLTMPGVASPTDEICESIIKTAIKYGRIAIDDPYNYEARASLMWTGSLSHVGLTSAGRNFYMISHQIEHEISGMYDRVAHGAGLAVVFPAWLKFAYKFNPDRFFRYAVQIWGCGKNGERESVILDGISRTEDFFKSIGMPVRLSELEIDESVFDAMASKCTNYGKRRLPGYIDYNESDIKRILMLAK